MVSHQTPSENTEPIELTDIFDDSDKLARFAPLVEYVLTSGDPTVNMIDRTGQEKLGFSRHGILHAAWTGKILPRHIDGFKTQARKDRS